MFAGRGRGVFVGNECLLAGLQKEGEIINSFSYIMGTLKKSLNFCLFQFTLYIPANNF